MGNHVELMGLTTGILTINHVFKGKNGERITVLETDILYTSKNQITNNIKVLVYKGTKFAHLLSRKGKFVKIEGNLRSFNKDSWGKRITEVFVSPKSVKELSNKLEYKNSILIDGEICGMPLFKRRTTGKLVTEAKIKVKRLNQSHKYDYLHVVAFGNNALELRKMEIGDKVKIKGRIHSRTFNFKYEENGKVKEVIRTALEICIHEFFVKRPSIKQNAHDESLSVDETENRFSKEKKYRLNFPSLSFRYKMKQKEKLS